MPVKLQADTLPVHAVPNKKKYRISSGELVLENGELIERLDITFHTFGKLNADRSNVVWVSHALTANSDVSEWWPQFVGPGKMLDTERDFIVCANALGSCYGTTGPLSAELPENQRGLNFPQFTIRDMVMAHHRVAEFLEIDTIRLLVGASQGGQQALEWAIMEPKRFKNMLLLATNAVHSAYGKAFNESQRLALKSDRSFLENDPRGGRSGLIAARSIALLSYRSYDGYRRTQTDADAERTTGFAAASYQRYQGEKLAARFNAFSYYRLTQAMDSHHVGRNRKSAETALQLIRARTLVIGIDSDLLFPLNEQQFLARWIPESHFARIHSDFGHDGFLLECTQITDCVSDFLYNDFNAFKQTIFKKQQKQLL